MYYTNSNGLYSEFDNDEKRSKLLTIANLYYATVFLVFAILMYIFKYNGYTWIGKIINSQYKDNSSAIGDQLVGRTGLTLALWFLILGMCTLLNPNMRDSYQFKIHTRYYIIKTLVLFGIFAGFLFLPDEIISFYLRMSMYTTFLYLIFQMFFLMDFFHNINEKYTQKENQIIPFALLAIMTIMIIVVYGVSMYLFAPKSCKVNQTLLSTNFVIAILFLIISAFSEHHSAFTAALVGGYIMYLTVMAFYREDTQCNRLQNSTNSLVFTIISSLMMIFYNVYSAFTATFKFHLFDDEEFKCCDHEICQNHDEESKNFSLSFFHFVFCLAAGYVCMITTSWLGGETHYPWRNNSGKISKWVNIGACYFIVCLYIWVLIAPYVCKDREF